MLDGLGMAETTPGPLIQVVQYVGFMGAFRDAAPFSPVTSGVIASVIVTWVTFVPCFIWILLGAPYVERLRGSERLNAALSTITAAVVGVILNLAVWFALHVFFAELDARRIGVARLLVPEFATLDIAAFLISLGAFVMLFHFRRDVIQTLLIATAVGALVYLFTG
jgi:chromate transporter